jgi:polyphosphate kinase
MVRMSGLYESARETPAEAAADGFTGEEQLAAVLASVGEITSRQAACAEECLAELARRGTRVLPVE